MAKPIIVFYHSLRHLAVTILGNKFNELEWRYRHIYKRDWAGGYLKTIFHPHRQLLVQEISANAPFTDVLEIGCASGPNLYLLAKKYPNARFVGIDINPEAIKVGNQFFKQQGNHNVSLFVGKADALRFSDKSFDIVFTDAVLLCLGSNEIRKVAEEIQRLARKAIILVEQHSEHENELGSYHEKWWLRNYIKLFESSDRHVSTTKIPAEVWGGNWGKFGRIIKIQMQPETISLEKMPVYVETGEPAHISIRS